MISEQLKQKAATAEAAHENGTTDVERAHYRALALSYNDAAAMVEAFVDPGVEFVEEVVEAAVKFCRSHCFHGRKDGIGESAECSICPLSRWTLGVETENEQVDDEAAMIKRREERASTEAKQALGRLAAKGADTFAADNRLVRQGNDVEVDERTVGYKVIE